MKMRAFSALPLDDDIVDRIMTFCPTFSALQSTILASKAFYSIFQTHPKSIMRAVAYNIVGPALPQALRVVRYEYHNDDSDIRQAKDLTPNELAEKCPEDHTPSVITAQEKRMLLENSEIVDELEDVYSFTQKDRTSRTSVLTPDESHRFRRAMYRIMLYTGIFRGDRYSIEELDELSAEDVQRIQAQRTAVLSEFPTDELREIWAVVRFLRGVFEQTADAELMTPLTLDVLLSTGPRGALEAWNARSHEILEDDVGFSMFDLEDLDDQGLFGGYFEVPLKTVLVNRKVKSPEDVVSTTDTSSSSSSSTSNAPAPATAPVSTVGAAAVPGMGPMGGQIALAMTAVPAMTDEERKKKEKGDEVARKIILVDGVVGAGDTCSQCASPGGLSLLCRGNWHRLPLHPSQLLKNKLRFNQSLSIPFGAATHHLVGSDDIGAWVEGMFAYREGVSAVISSTTTTTVGAGGPATTTSTSTASVAGTSAAGGGASILGGATGGNDDATTQIGTGTYATWTADLSYCTPCLTRFLEDHVWRWYLAERVKGGWVPPENCWYGYDCRTMTHKYPHATGKNHLCVPTRGDR